MGTDHVQLARQGGIMHGIDLTQAHLELAQKNLACNGFSSELVHDDCEHMPYADNSFDFVYSIGVLHHTPDACKAFEEIHRVLRPGGSCWIAVYHKNSLFYWWSKFLCTYILKRGFLHETLKQCLSRIEYPGTNPNLIVDLYTRKSLKKRMQDAGFSCVTIQVDHLRAQDILVWGKYLSQKMLNKLAPYVGWYVIAQATK